ncbi:MAG TPA: rRNA maturation RNase YbeY [Hyphomicrobiaceae bacterium]|nr:rRNA maturation RNase YbeY [Hyphomicrobiaceae bacterium]
MSKSQPSGRKVAAKVATAEDSAGVAASHGVTLFAVVDDGAWGEEAALVPHLDAIGRVLSDVPEAGLRAGSSATIVFAGDLQVKALNAQFRNIDKPTNVLSFPAGGEATDEDGQPYLGDVILAYETVAREAAEQGLAFDHHLVHLVVHGVLHLAGFDHMTESEAGVMEALEIRILARLGIADPYAD